MNKKYDAIYITYNYYYKQSVEHLKLSILNLNFINKIIIFTTKELSPELISLYNIPNLQIVIPTINESIHHSEWKFHILPYLTGYKNPISFTDYLIEQENIPGEIIHKYNSINVIKKNNIYEISTTSDKRYGFFAQLNEYIQTINYTIKNKINIKNIQYKNAWTNYCDDGDQLYNKLFKINNENIDQLKNLNSDNNLIFYPNNHFIFTNVKICNSIINAYFNDSDFIIKKTNEIELDNKIKVENTIAVYYRTTDKITELAIPKIEDYILEVEKLLKINPDLQIIFQSDSQSATEIFKKEFKNCIIFDNITRTDSNTGIHFLLEKEKLYEDIITFKCITNILSKCKYLICNISSISSFMVMKRGYTENVLQFDTDAVIRDFKINKKFCDKAIYGSEYGFANVTDIINSTTNSYITVTNDTMLHDPHPGTFKTLTLYINDKIIKIKEGNILYFDDLLPPIKREKLHLKDTTLICIDCVNVDRAIKSINYSLEECTFDNVKLLTSIDNTYKHIVKIPKINNIQEYSIFCIKELYKYVDTKYMLIIQHDGWIIDSSKWLNEFYNYDYIGGISNWSDENKGGNGGFSFRTTELMKKAAEIVPLEHCHPEDTAVSSAQKNIIINNHLFFGYRKELEAYGFKIATNDIQLKFAISVGRYTDQFGHHSCDLELVQKYILKVNVNEDNLLLALYGTEENNIDVTEIVKNNFKDDKSILIHNNIFNTAPAPFINKYLKLTFLQNQKIETLKIDECTRIKKNIMGCSTPYKIYDCFLFFNELELLEIRLNEMYDIVEKFIIIEGNKTHSGIPRISIFEQNKHLFEKYLDKIEYRFINLPDSTNTWTVENYQREQILTTLKELNVPENSILIVSDCDEIPNSNSILINIPHILTNNYIGMIQPKYNYKLNLLETEFWNKGFITQLYKIGKTLTQIRLEPKTIDIKCGWHFSWLGNKEKIIEKIKSFAHQEFNNTTTIDNIENNINDNKYFVNNNNLTIVKIDDTFPKIITQNLNKYKEFIELEKIDISPPKPQIDNYNSIKHNNIEIKFYKAIYGTDLHNIDVTNIINSTIDDDILIDNNTMKSDPHPYQHKNLKIYYKNNLNNDIIHTFEEGEILNLSTLTPENCKFTYYLNLYEQTLNSTFDEHPIWNDYIKNIVVISKYDLNSEELKNIKLIEQHKNIKIQKFDAIYPTQKHPAYARPCDYGCALSHCNVVKLAKENIWDNVMILEDDVVFHKQFNYYMNQIIEDLKNINWDICYGFKNSSLNETVEIIKEYNNIKQIKGILNLNCYILNKTSYNYIIELYDNQFKNLGCDNACNVMLKNDIKLLKFVPKINISTPILRKISMTGLQVPYINEIILKTEKIPHFYQKIEGWFDFQDIYKSAVDKYDNAHFVEIGSWKGKSAAFMATEIANSNKNIKFDCIDTWKGSEEHQQDPDIIKYHDILPIFLKNTEPVKNYINPIHLDSIAASKLYADKSLDLVFIDASHDYENVKNDIIHWLPKIKLGGIIAGHDINMDGVNKAVTEMLITFNTSNISWFKYINSNVKFDKAIYGTQNTFIDVTQIINNVINNEILIDNNTMKIDPCPGQFKTLKLYYKNNLNENIINVIPEGKILNFSCLNQYEQLLNDIQPLDDKFIKQLDRYEQTLNYTIDDIPIWNDYIKNIVVISKYELNSKELKNIKLIEQHKNIKIQKFDAIYPSIPHPAFSHMGLYGVFTSHINVIKMAKENKWENVMILEDDVILHKKFNYHLNNIVKDLKTYDWDVFIAHKDNQPTVKPGEFTESFEYITKGKYILSLACYVINSKCFDVLIKEYETILTFNKATNRDNLDTNIYYLPINIYFPKLNLDVQNVRQCSVSNPEFSYINDIIDVHNVKFNKEIYGTEIKFNDVTNRINNISDTSIIYIPKLHNTRSTNVQNKIQHFYKNIEGGMFDFEYIYKLVVDKYDNAHFVEIGCWKGTSASFMAVEIANSCKNIKFDCVDTWKGSYNLQQDPDIIKYHDILPIFLKNTEPVKNYINPFRFYCCFKIVCR